MKAWRAAALGATALAVVASLHDASAQRIDPRRPAIFVVGAPSGAAPMHRVDGRRSGLSRHALPAGTLRIPWKKATSFTVDQPALAGPDGLAVVSTHGDVAFLDDAGEERAVIRVAAAQVGPATITSDGTVVYATGNGEVVGVRRTSTAPRFTTRIGGERASRTAAPLSLDDGGVVVATASELVLLDAEGNVRARSAIPEAPAAPLLAASGDRVVVVGVSGAVFVWSPGREPVRAGSFAAPIDGGAALASPTTLVAVIEGNHLAEVDLARGSRTTRAIASQGLFLGPPALRPRLADGGGGAVATLLAITTTRGHVVTLDASGQELLRAPIASYPATTLADGGAPPLVAPPHVPPLVDGRGTIAYAATDGRVGVIGPDGAVEEIGEVLCPRAVRSGVVGLTPTGPGAFAVTCDGGTVVKITGSR